MYDDANQLTQATGNQNIAFLYDYNGNMYRKTKGTTVTDITYDALNRVTGVQKTNLPPQSYAYDHDGGRISKTVGSTTTNYLYNGPDIVAEYTSAWGSPLAQYTHGPNMDDPIIRIGSSTRYYHQDGLGSVVAMSTPQGECDALQTFDAWGNRLIIGGTTPLYGYTGRELDDLGDFTGFVYYRARYYDPTIGRFTQRDPIGLQGGINQYAYVNNNPVNFTDPQGRV